MQYGGIARRAPRTLEVKGSTLLRVTTPTNLDLALEGLVRKVLREQPKQDDIYNFAAEYFEALVEIRDRAEVPNATPRDICPNHTEAEACELIKLATSFAKPAYLVSLVTQKEEISDGEDIRQEPLEELPPESDVEAVALAEVSDNGELLEESDVKVLANNDNDDPDPAEVQIPPELTSEALEEGKEKIENEIQEPDDTVEEAVHNEEPDDSPNNETDSVTDVVPDEQNNEKTEIEETVEESDETNDEAVKSLNETIQNDEMVEPGENIDVPEPSDNKIDEVPEKEESPAEQEQNDNEEKKLDDDHDIVISDNEEALVSNEGDLEVHNEEVPTEINTQDGTDPEETPQAPQADQDDMENVVESGQAEGNSAETIENLNTDEKDENEVSVPGEDNNTAEDEKTEVEQIELPIDEDTGVQGEIMEPQANEDVVDENEKLISSEKGEPQLEPEINESAKMLENEIYDTITTEGSAERDIIREFIEKEKEFSTLGNSTLSVEVAEVYEKKDGESLDESAISSTEDPLKNEESTDVAEEEEVMTVTVVPQTQTSEINEATENSDNLKNDDVDLSNASDGNGDGSHESGSRVKREVGDEMEANNDEVPPAEENVEPEAVPLENATSNNEEDVGENEKTVAPDESKDGTEQQEEKDEPTESDAAGEVSNLISEEKKEDNNESQETNEKPDEPEKHEDDVDGQEEVATSNDVPDNETVADNTADQETGISEDVFGEAVILPEESKEDEVNSEQNNEMNEQPEENSNVDESDESQLIVEAGQPEVTITENVSGNNEARGKTEVTESVMNDAEAVVEDVIGNVEEKLESVTKPPSANENIVMNDETPNHEVNPDSEIDQGTKPDTQETENSELLPNGTSADLSRSRSSKDTESLEDETSYRSSEVVTLVESQQPTIADEDSKDDENDVIVPLNATMGAIDEKPEDQLMSNLNFVHAAMVIQRNFRKYLRNKNKDAASEVEGSIEKNYSVDNEDGNQMESTSTESSLSSSATKIANRRFILKKSTTATDYFESQSLSETSDKEQLSRTKRSLSTAKSVASDAAVWGTIEQELETAAATIQHGFRNYKARKRLRREDAIQINSEDSTGTIPNSPRLHGTGEFHDTIVLDVHPR